MIAAQIHEFGSLPRVDVVGEPVPTPGTSVVDVRAATLAHIDLTVASGQFVFRPELPYIPGAEAAGVIVTSDSHPAGTRVRVRGAGVGLQSDGTCAERIVVPDEAIHPIPDDLDFVTAGSFFSPVASAYAAVHLVGALEDGESVGVIGAGGAVGRVAAQLAMRTTSAPVVGIAGSPRSAGRVPEGVACRIGTGELDDEDRFDLLVDCAGGPALHDALAHVRPGGRVVLVGYVAGERLTLDLPNFMAADVRLLPLNLMRWTPRLGDLTPALLDLVRTGVVDVPTTVVALHDVPDAVAELRRGALQGRLVVEPGRARARG